MYQDKTDADEFQDDTHRKEFRNWMALLLTAMYLDRYEEDVNGKENETLFKDVLLIVREVIDKRTVE